MMQLLSELTFLNPYLLSGLAALPVLWFILRITPPSPVLIEFPAARFLKGLVPERRAPSRTPWWILLLRILIAALIILAMAHPVLNPASMLGGGGPLRLVIDNGWESAQVWDDQKQAAREALAQAEREGREVYLLTTAPEVIYEGPVTASQARSKLKGLMPRPWPADYNSARQKLKETPTSRSIENLWLGTSLGGEGFKKLARDLQASGSLTYMLPDEKDMPVLLRPENTGTSGMSATLVFHPDYAGSPFTVRALAKGGKVVDTRKVEKEAGDVTSEVEFELPVNLRSSVSGFDIRERQGAGSRFWTEAGSGTRIAGIFAPEGDEEATPLTKSVFYLSRALEPYAITKTGSIPKILKESPAIIILPDTGAMTADLLNDLESWVKRGGLLLRFAGPKMAENADKAFLTPVPIRVGGRAMDGALTWDRPKKLAPFPQNSPFADFKADEEATIRRQLLAEPTENLDEKVWARLEDGTPLITASPLEQGLLVLVHTTAGPQWSDLALSGVYVRILERLVEISANLSAAVRPEGVLQPLSVSDGFGNLVKPGPEVKPIDAGKLGELEIGPEHPPGIYARSGYKVILNLGDYINLLDPAPSLPLSVGERFYNLQSIQTDLRPPLIIAAGFLFLLDWALMMLLSSGFAAGLSRYAAIFAFAFFIAAQPAPAQNRDAVYAGDLYLAYMKTGDPALDAQVRKGMENLAFAMGRRTSAEPAGVVGLDPEEDELAFFPLIYWAIDPDVRPLTNHGAAKIQSYLDHGGTIVFDTRDRNVSHGTGITTRNGQVLRALLAPIDIPPLIKLPDEHVLGKTFYLLEEFPGRYQGGELWLEKSSENSRDRVSSVIIGGDDWAGAWASESGMVSSRQREMAFRSGVNFMMYALTGNYKADQVHMNSILERLGK